MILVNTILLVLNIGLSFFNYKIGKYKSSVFNSFAAGFVAASLLVSILS